MRRPLLALAVHLGRQAVQDSHIIAVLEQEIGHMRADEPGAPGDQDSSHDVTSLAGLSVSSIG